MINKIINGYIIKHFLGEGGMASVYYAEDNLGRKAAIKILKQDFFLDQDIKERFRQEARVMQKLNHSNIRQFLGLKETDEHIAILMEYLEGMDLEEFISNKGLITETMAIDWLNQILPALDLAHIKGIVHRDIKPSNLFLTSTGQLKLLDFGIAKLLNGQGLEITKTTSRIGSTLYMSPEQIKSPKYVDYQTDIYSLGATFHFLLSSQSILGEETETEYNILTKIINEPLPPLQNISIPLNNIIQKATQKEKRYRFSNCKGMIALINEIKKGDEEQQLWEGAIQSNTILNFADYLCKYPDGCFGKEASKKIQQKIELVLKTED